MKFELGGLLAEGEEQTSTSRMDGSVDCGGDDVWAFAVGAGQLAPVGYWSTSAARLQLRPRLLVVAFPRKNRLPESDDLKRRCSGGVVKNQSTCGGEKGRNFDCSFQTKRSRRVEVLPH